MLFEVVGAVVFGAFSPLVILWQCFLHLCFGQAFSRKKRIQNAGFRRIL